VGFQLNLSLWVRVPGSKIFQKTGFWVQVGVGFCKNIKIPAKFLFFVENNLKNLNFLQK
jgi:hypothetical protein